LQMLEQFFELKVAAPPYRQAAMHSFIKLFSVPPPVLKDLIQIIRLELKPEQCRSMCLQWNVQLGMRASYTSFPIIPLGTPGIVNTKNKLLIFLDLTRITDQPVQQHPIVVLPIIYDIGNQVTQLVDRRDLNTPGIIIQAANMQLRKFTERGVPTTESSLYAAIHDLLSNLTLQMPGQPGPMPGGPPFMQGAMSGPPQQMPINQMGPVQQMNLPPDHPQVMNPQVMNQVMGGPQGMNQGYGMGQMGE